MRLHVPSSLVRRTAAIIAVAAIGLALTPPVPPALAQAEQPTAESVGEPQPRSGQTQRVRRGSTEVEVTRPATVQVAGGRAALANRLIVGFKESLDEGEREGVRRAAGARGVAARIVQRVGPWAELLHLDGAASLEQAILAFAADSRVAYVEPDYVVRTLDVPNDPDYAQQWGLPKVQAPAAWDVTKGSTAVRVAILDCGILSPSSAWGDANGFPDGHPDVGSKVVLEADFSGSGSTDDFCDHGTHVAGIAAAATNNGLGVAGLGRDAALLNGKVLDNTGSGSVTTIANGINWAVANQAKVINLSLGRTGPCTTTEQNAINAAWAAGAVIVAAAGNAGLQGAMAPANCANVLAVGATTQSDARASFSNYGAATVHVAAPGEGIYSSNSLGGYVSKNGTSMAAPLVSGLAALVWASPWGAQNSNQVVVDRIKQWADPVAGTGTTWQFGRINAANAVGPQVIEAPAFVNDGLAEDLQATRSTSSLSANWAAVLGATGYQYAIGTAPGGTNVRGYTSLGLVTSVTATGLTLSNGTTYYVSVRARFGSTLTSAATSSNGIRVDTTGPSITAVSAVPVDLSPNGDGTGDTQVLRYTLSEPALVSIRVTNASGVTVRTLLTGAGRPGGANEEAWDGRNDTGGTLADGSYTYRLNATDQAGNASSQVTRSTRIDTTPPAPPTISAPTSPVPVNTATYTIRGSAAAGSLVRVWRDEDDDGAKDSSGSPVASLQLGSSATTYSLAVPLTPNASNDFVVTATDPAANESAAAAAARITHDGIAPVMEADETRLLSAPAISPNGDGVLDSVRVRFSLSEAARVTVEVRDASNRLTRTLVSAASRAAGTYEETWDGRTSRGGAVANGTYTIRVFARDLANNTSAALSAPVRIDTVRPSISSVSDTPDPFSPNGDGANDTTTIRFTLSEAAEVTVEIRDSGGLVVRTLLDGQQQAAGAKVVVWDGRDEAAAGLTAGTYTYRITAVDAAGNSSTVASGTVRIG